jgi:hypothetical protein
VWPIILPLGWVTDLDDSGAKVLGFSDEDGAKSAVLPKGFKTAAPAGEIIPGSAEAAAAASSTAAASSSSGPAGAGAGEAEKPKEKETDPRARAERVCREALKQYRERKAAGKRGFVHRPWLFRNTTTDTFLAVNASERSTLSKILEDPETFQKVAVLKGEDAKEFGFEHDKAPLPDEPATLWNAVPDASTGRCYFVNVESKETAWAIPEFGRIVARLIPRDHPVVQRATSFTGTIQELGRRKIEAAALEGRATLSDEAREAAAAAEAAQAGASALPPLMEGWLFKSDPRGRNWQKRWLKADGKTGELAWYHSAPAMTLSKYELKEEPKGSIPLAGATIELISADKAKGLPSQFGVIITAAARSMKVRRERVCCGGGGMRAGTSTEREKGKRGG